MRTGFKSLEVLIAPEAHFAPYANDYSNRSLKLAAQLHTFLYKNDRRMFLTLSYPRFPQGDFRDGADCHCQQLNSVSAQHHECTCAFWLQRSPPSIEDRIALRNDETTRLKTIEMTTDIVSQLALLRLESCWHLLSTECYWRFGGTCCLQFHGRKMS